MDFTEQLRVLEAARGDPAKLALSTVDLAYPALPDAERIALKQSLEAAAIPHWCDEAILAALLEVPKQESAARFTRLRGLSVLESFSARGGTAINVHEATRLTIRKWMVAEEEARFRMLSERAATCFEEDSTPAGRVEWIYHLLCTDPVRGATELESLDRNWGISVRPEDRYALALALRELEDTGLVQGRARAWVLLVNAWANASRGEVTRLEEEAGRILRLAQAADDPRAEASAQRLLGDLLKAQGKLEAAQMAFEEDLAISRRLAKQDLSKSGWQWDLAVALIRLGDLFKTQGKLEAAQAAFEESVAINRRLAEQDVSNTGWQREFAVAQNRMGDVLQTQGKLEAAQAAFGEALAVSECLAEKDASNTAWQWEFAVAQYRMGDVLEAQGKLEAAQAAFREALAISERLAEQDPSNAGRRHDLAVAHSRVGDVLHAQGKLDAAEAAFREALAISGRLAEQDPSNARRQRDLAVAHSRVGDVLQAQGKLTEALSSYRASFMILQNLVVHVPKNTNLQQDLSISENRIRAVQGKLFEAQGIGRRLGEKDPCSTDLRRDLAVIYGKVGEALQAQSKLAQAQAAFEESASIIWRLIEEDPSNASLQVALATVHGRVGEMLQGWLKTSQLRRLIDDLFGRTETTLNDMELIRPSGPGDIELVAYQELIAYPAYDAVPESILREWYIQNPSGFNMIIYDEKKIGHFNLLPFKEDFLNKFADGEVIEKDAKVVDIFPPERQESINDLYVESLAILHPFIYPKAQILFRLCSEFAEIVSRICPPHQVRYVYSLAATKPGAKLLSHLNFSEMPTERPRKDGLSIFRTSLTDLIHVLSRYSGKTTRRRDTLKIVRDILESG